MNACDTVSNGDTLMCSKCYDYVCLFGFLFGVFHPTLEFFNHLETLSLTVKGGNFDMCLALTTIEQ